MCIEWTPEGADDYAGGAVLRDRAGGVLRVSLGPGDVDCRPYYTADRDDWIVKALVASEDGSFWTHCGVRPFSVLRAAFQNVFHGRRISGASTITMQAVRLIRPHPKTYWWKWKEAVMALKMERAETKEWILSQYLNRAPYGSNLVGVEAAARGWFGKGAKELGLGEAAMLAGMIQAPSRFRPDRGYDKAIARRDYVLGRMLKLGMATADQVAAAKSVRPVVSRSQRPFRAPHFCDWAMRELALDRAGQRRSGDFTTTLDPDVQATCEHAVDAAAEAGGFACAAVVMRPATGEVLALACSGDYFDATGGQVNTALAPRPAGSTLKPFLAAQAMDCGLVSPSRRLADVPAAFKGYRPANFDAKYRGRVTLRESLVLSLNVPFVRLLDGLGVETFADHLKSLGFAHVGADAEEHGLGLAIGNAEVTLLELVGAYGTFARGGAYRPAVAFTDASNAGATRRYAPGTAHLVSDMLSGAERSAAALGHVADVECPRFAWKTGTSSAYRDAWTVAWNPECVVGVWCGHLAGGFGDLTLVGAKAAAPVAFGIARALYPQNDGPWFAEPPDVRRVRVCTLTGMRANADCPETEEGFEVSGAGAALCEAHRRDAEGKAVTRDDPLLVAFAGGATGALAIARPEDGATFTRTAGALDQRVVCQPAGNAEGARLWWFVDGRPAGETVGSAPLALPMEAGEHTLVCATEDGVSATVRFTVGL